MLRSAIPSLVGIRQPAQRGAENLAGFADQPPSRSWCRAIGKGAGHADADRVGPPNSDWQLQRRAQHTFKVFAVQRQSAVPIRWFGGPNPVGIGVSGTFTDTRAP